MTRASLAAFALFALTAVAAAQDGEDVTAAPDTEGNAEAADAAEEVLPISPAAPQEGLDVDLDDYRWVARPVIVFADSPNDPRFREQLDLILRRLDPLEERDVVVFYDADPSANSLLRQRLRPRGFQLAILGRDGEVERRSPSPWEVRLIMGVIDRMPDRQQEMRLERAGEG